MKLNLNKKKKLTRKLGEQSFQITPYITLYQKDFILNKLLEFYNESKSEGDFVNYILEIRCNLDIMIISATTDIELDETVKYDALLSSGLIDIVRDTVINYDELYQDAMFMLNVVKMSEIMPNVESLNGLFNELPDMLKSMPPEEVERLEMMARVGMSNIKVGDFEGGN
jgi:hypothetical protein